MESFHILQAKSLSCKEINQEDNTTNVYVSRDGKISISESSSLKIFSCRKVAPVKHCNKKK